MATKARVLYDSSTGEILGSALFKDDSPRIEAINAHWEATVAKYPPGSVAYTDITPTANGCPNELEYRINPGNQQLQEVTPAIEQRRNLYAEREAAIRDYTRNKMIEMMKADGSWNPSWDTADPPLIGRQDRAVREV